MKYILILLCMGCVGNRVPIIIPPLNADSINLSINRWRLMRMDTTDMLGEYKYFKQRISYDSTIKHINDDCEIDCYDPIGLYIEGDGTPENPYIFQ